jgi:hypothetical protein
MRQFFSGVYGFRLQGFLRAPSYDKGEYLGAGNPLLQQPIVIAGFSQARLFQANRPRRTQVITHTPSRA